MLGVVQRQAGFTLIEVLIAVAIVGILASIAVPALMSARRYATESATASSMHAIKNAQYAFAASCAGGLFATKLSDLAEPPPAGGEPFLAADLSAADRVVKGGYVYTMGGGSDGAPGGSGACNGVPAEDLSTSFYATATPDSAAGGTLSNATTHYWMGVSGTLFASAGPITSTLGRSDPPGARPFGGGSPGDGGPAGGGSPGGTGSPGGGEHPAVPRQ